MCTSPRLSAPALHQTRVQHMQGRSIYAEGTVDAVLFLAKQIEDGASQKLYNMVDVLKAGAMR